MLMDIVRIKCDIFPKAKYRLYINNQQRYYFVTTRYSEDECIELIKDRIKDYSYTERSYYKITKVKDGREINIKTGKI